MPRPASSRPAAPRSPSTATGGRASLTVRLQILAAVFVPMLLLGLWLQSKGFFQAP